MTHHQTRPGSPFRAARLLGALLLAFLVVTGAAVASQDSSATTTPGVDDLANTSSRPDPTTVAPTTQSATTPASPPTDSTSTTAAPANPARGESEVGTAGTSATPAVVPPAAAPVPGDFAEDVARAEAERLVAQPLAVVRLDNAAFVFSGADPEVAAGVQAWLATQPGPHDKFGNFMGPGYRGSYRPDNVNGQLIQFLANYLRGKRLVAVSEAQADGLSTLQNQNRRNAIEQIVSARREAASHAATAPGTSTNGSENVPNIANGGDNTNGQNGSQGSSGSTSGTTGSGTSGPAAPTTPGTAPASSAAARALENKYPGIKIDSQPKEWTAEELADLDKTLAALPKEFWAKCQFRRTSVISVDGRPDDGIFGVTRTGPNVDYTLLEISDRSFSENSRDRIDFPTPPFNEEQSKTLQYQGTVAHELVHNYLRHQPENKFWTDLSKNPLIGGENGWASKFGWSYDPTGQKWALDRTRMREIPTVYAGSDNPSEDIAESVMLYLYDPQRLRAASQERYDFIRDQLKVPEVGNAPATYPPPRDDPRYQG
jgi:hypothetical protein